MLLRTIDKQGLFAWMLLSGILSGVLMIGFEWNGWVCAFLSINIVTFVLMLVDKVQAVQSGRRLSERSLYVMTLLGGSVGMLTAMYTLRHKNRKPSFQLVVWTLVLLQLGLILYESSFLTSFFYGKASF